MSANITITAELQDRPIASLRTFCDKTDKRESLRAFIEELMGVLAGRRAMVRTCIASACASATATIVASSMSANDTIIVAGVTLTAKASPSGSAEFLLTASSDTTTAAAIAACINAHATIQKVVRATSAHGVVTLTCIYPGTIGNFVTLTKSSSGITVTGSGFLASGACDEVDSYQLGYTPST
jgi:phage tail sheath gpL-like